MAVLPPLTCSSMASSIELGCSCPSSSFSSRETTWSLVVGWADANRLYREKIYSLTPGDPPCSTRELQSRDFSADIINLINIRLVAYRTSNSKERAPEERTRPCKYDEVSTHTLRPNRGKTYRNSAVQRKREHAETKEAVRISSLCLNEWRSSFELT